MYYPDYLIHYNKNHSKSNGQFVSGDGDGDGISNDHANQRKKKSGVFAGWEKDKNKLKKTRQKMIKDYRSKKKQEWNKKSKADKAFTVLSTTAEVASAVALGSMTVRNNYNKQLDQSAKASTRAKQYVSQVQDVKWTQDQAEYKKAAAQAKYAGGDW